MKKSLIKKIRNYAIMFFGLSLNAFGWTGFLLPHKIVGGGVNGIGIMVNEVTGFPVGLFYLVVNIFLILWAIKAIGAHFGAKSIVGILGFSAMMSILQPLTPNPIVSDAFMSTILGGFIGGFGLGLVFWQGGSTGGTDIIALILSKRYHSSPGKITLYVNLLIITSSYLLFRSWEMIIYGIVAMSVSSFALDQFLEGTKMSAQIFVFSEKYQSIADNITKIMHRGVTVFDGLGWFTKEKRSALMILVPRKEVPEVLSIVKETDQEAFISVASVRSVYGQGFGPLEF
ncbi:MAG TPA: YitT family protein [Thermotogota bacterium]|nr:YitT family protein [Thermotogota bacterium]HQC36974.1 YitT family protein [Thermotogota bacterium]